MANVGKDTGFSDLDNRIKRHKQQRVTVISIGIVMIVVVCVYLLNSYKNRVFNSYKVEKSIERAEGNEVNYVAYGTNLLRYSRDGASAINSAGTSLWNGSYEMKNPHIDICGNYVVVADIGGYNFVVFDGNNSGVPYKVNLPILQVEVANQGVVAVLMEDKETNLIQLIYPSDTVKPIKAEILTVVEKNGFPLDISLSQDGNKLVTSYVAVQKGIVENYVTFYNFSEVGQNQNNMLGMKSMEGNLVADVEFLGNNTIAIYGESSVVLYTMVEIPSKDGVTIQFEQEIKSSFHTEEYLGFVLEPATGEEENRLVVYNLKGTKVLDTKIDFRYEKIVMYDKEIVFYSDLECNIVKLNGVEKFKHTFPSTIDGLVPINNYNKYFYVNNATVDIIKLTEE